MHIDLREQFALQVHAFGGAFLHEYHVPNRIWEMLEYGDAGQHHFRRLIEQAKFGEIVEACPHFGFDRVPPFLRGVVQAHIKTRTCEHDTKRHTNAASTNYRHLRHYFPRSNPQ